MIEVINKPWKYKLFKNDNEYIVCVLCGDVGLYELCLLLDDIESKCYQLDGEKYINEFVKKIQDNPAVYISRRLDNVT